MNHKELIEREAERCYPAHSSWHYNYAFMRGANFALEMEMWVKVEDGLPEVRGEFNESDYVMCIDRTNMPFAAWYNSNTKRWYYAHYIASGVPNPTHWQPLPKLPQ